MSTQTQDKTVTRVNMGRVYEKDGSLYFAKTTKTFKFLLINQQGESVYSKTPSEIKTENITPETLGFSKRESWEIYVYKTTHEDLEEKTEYYSMLLTFAVPNEARYKTAYFKKAKSGRVFLTFFDSGTCSEVSINSPEWTTRGKARKLAPDTILNRDAPVFTLSASGELERRLDSEKVW
jgi:hypothetical protein